MQAEIITIGDELLIGQTIDTNSAWIGERLSLAGIKVVQVRSIPDDPDRIQQALRDLMPATRLVLITGGLGPTNDDITRNTLCTYFGDELVLNQEVLDQLSLFFEKRGRPMNEHNRAQAMVPSRCKVLPNALGTAPGMWFEEDGKVVVSMPGVPYEMKAIMTDHVLPRLSGRSNGYHILHKHIHTFGIPESELMVKIADWEAQLPAPMKLAYLPSPGMVKLRITVESTGDRALLLAGVEEAVKELQGLIPEYIVGYDDDNLEHGIGRMLLDAGQTLAVAESCTGGFLAHRITSVSVSSAYLKGGVVAYANEIKATLLGVKESTLEEHGAVSGEVVKEMVEGTLQATGADWAIATSGVAGPAGGSEEKPVGTVWIAVGNKEQIVVSHHLFGNDRMANIQRSTNTALKMLRKELLKLFVD
jgi:nicotinamide-nucleotide amidase